MSDWGPILAALEAELRVACPDLPAGVQGFERGIRLGEELIDSELPHVFAHNPIEEMSAIEPGAQEAVAFSVELDLWTRGETQEAVAGRVDAFRDRIRANPTLGGLVDRVRVIRRAVVEYAGKAERAGVIIVATEKVI